MGLAAGEVGPQMKLGCGWGGLAADESRRGRGQAAREVEPQVKLGCGHGEAAGEVGQQPCPSGCR